MPCRVYSRISHMKARLWGFRLRSECFPKIKYAVSHLFIETLLDFVHSDQLNQHLDGVQGDLESIKEYLRNEDYTLDANTLLGVS